MERRAIKNTDVATVATNGSGPQTFAQVQAEIEAAMAAGELSSLPEKFVWFEKKLKAALTDSAVTTSELEKIARETDVAIEVARQEALAARERGLDLCADARLARAEIDDVEFFVSKMLTQRPRLEALLQTRRQADQSAAYLAIYEQLKGEGAALAQELANAYGAVMPLIDLFGRLRTFRERCRALHLTDPGGLPHVNDPELKARRIDGFTAEVKSLLDAVRLPDFASGRELWPEKPPSFAASFAASMVPADPGPMWSDPIYQQHVAEERRQEQERLAAARAQAAKMQLDRENKELRENWNASQGGRHA